MHELQCICGMKKVTVLIFPSEKSSSFPVSSSSSKYAYLVFGVKDFSRNILPIRKAIIGKISFSASYQLKFCTFILKAGQFIPLQIIKKELPVSVVSPGIILAQAEPSKIDGGNWVSFSICAGF